MNRFNMFIIIYTSLIWILPTCDDNTFCILMEWNDNVDDDDDEDKNTLFVDGGKTSTLHAFE